MPKKIDFFDGAASSTVPTIGNIDTTSLITYANDAAYEAANAGSPVEGNIYANTTTGSVRYYDGSNWVSMLSETGTDTLENKTIDGTAATGNNTVTIDADDASYDNSTSGLTATDAQGAIDEVEGRLDTAESSLSTAQTDVSNLETLSGVAGATDNGTFTGTTIADSSSTKAALQSLETAVESAIPASEKAAANGVATLDGSGKVPTSQLTVNAFEYLGTWDASTNTPTLADGVGNTGDTYRVSVAGTQDLGSGNITFAIDDKVVYNPDGDWENWSGAAGGDLWSDPVNSNIVPDTDNTYTLGDSSNKFSVGHIRNIDSRGTTATASGLISLNNTSGDSLVRIQAGNTTPTGVASSGAMFDGFNLVGDLAVYSNNNNTVDSAATKSVAIETGNKTAGTGDSGDIKMTIGTSSGGSQGDFKFIKSGDTVTTGHVWTASASDGSGYWAASAGGGSSANDTLSNLSSPTAINQDLEFAGTNTIIIPNNVSYQGVFGGGTRTIARVDTAGRIQMGQSGVDFRIDGAIAPNSDGVTTNGTSALRWSNVSADVFEGAGGLTIGSQTTPSGIGSVAGIASGAVVDTGMWTSNNTNNDGVKSQDVFIETGNKTDVAASGNTGDISIKTGDAAGSGNSGPIILETGSSGSGTRGAIQFKEKSIDSATVNDVWTLQNTVTGEGAWSTLSASSVKTITTYSSTATASISDDVLILSGASFTLTLPTAVGATGKIFDVVHNGTHLTQVYTINGNGAETIRGNNTFDMHTNGQRLRIISDGANWSVLDSYTKTDWVDAGATIIGATTTGPTKSSSIVTDTMKWQRDGDQVKIVMNYRQSATTGSAAGSGDYLFGIPANMTIDTTVVQTSTTLGVAALDNDAAVVGQTRHGEPGANNLVGVASVYSTTQVRSHGRIAAITGNAMSTVGSSVFALSTNAAGNLWLSVTLPIDGWEY